MLALFFHFVHVNYLKVRDDVLCSAIFMLRLNFCFGGRLGFRIPSFDVIILYRQLQLTLKNKRECVKFLLLNSIWLNNEHFIEWKKIRHLGTLVRNLFCQISNFVLYLSNLRIITSGILFCQFHACSI